MPARPVRLRTQIALAIAGYALILAAGLGVLTKFFAQLSLHELTTMMLIFIGEAIAIAALAGSVLSRKLAGPMEAWASTADEIGRGNRNVTFPTARGSSELDRLGTTLQSMFAHLTESERGLEVKVAERTLALSETAAELKLINDGVASIIGRLQLDGRILYANRRYHEFFDLPQGSLPGRRVVEFAGAEAQALFDQGVAELKQGFESARYTRVVADRGPDRHIEVQLMPQRDSSGAIVCVFLIANDVTAQKTLEGLLQRQASSDSLTGLANKRHFGERLGQALARARRRTGQVALLYLDLDGFKPVNDRLGHAAGDALLKEVAARITANVRAGDTVARVGGDEFAVLLEDIASMEDAHNSAAKLTTSIAAPYALAEGDARITCSAGVAISPGDGDDVEGLMHHADTEMYRAKQIAKAQER